MRIFFTNTGSCESVLAKSPVEMEFQQAYLIFRKFRHEGSFLGIEINDKIVFQLYREKAGLYWIELLDRAKRVCIGCQANGAIVEQALKTVFDGLDIRECLKEFPLQWIEERLPA